MEVGLVRIISLCLVFNLFRNDAKLISLYHISENPNIQEFIPRLVDNPDAGVEGKAVWAINEKELPNYLLPRDCPRICYRNEENRKVIAIEEAWIDKINLAKIYLYVFKVEKFQEIDPIAGYWISREAALPHSVIRIDDLLQELDDRNITVKVLPRLHDERDYVINNFEHFSIIRYRNVQA